MDWMSTEIRALDFRQRTDRLIVVFQWRAAVWQPRLVKVSEIPRQELREVHFATPVAIYLHPELSYTRFGERRVRSFGAHQLAKQRAEFTVVELAVAIGVIGIKKLL